MNTNTNAAPAFEEWWNAHGQFCRSGGGDYEKSFAYSAWNAALSTAAQPPAIPTGWSITGHGEEVSLQSPEGERWRYRASSGTGTDGDFIYRFLRAMLAAKAEPVQQPGLQARIAELEANLKRATSALQQPERVPLTADDLREPKNGANWRVEWWNESARLMLPANKSLDSFQSYKNGTLVFTLKESSIQLAHKESI